MSGISVVEKHRRAALRLETAGLNRALEMMEALPEFAKDNDEADWITVGGPNDKGQFSAEQVTNIREQAQRLQYTASGRAILQTGENYIIGKRFSIDTLDEDPKGDVQGYWQQWYKANDFDLKSKELVRRVWRDGEVFIRWFKGSKDAPSQMRFVNPAQIVPGDDAKPTYGIKTDDNDVEVIEYYNRRWTTDSGETKQEQIPAEEIIHIKILVDSDVKRGVSFYIGASEFITHYTKWIRDRIQLNAIRQIFNMIGEPTTPTTSPSELKDQFTDVTRASASASDTKNKQVPKSGSVVYSRNVKWRMEALKINAADTKDDGRSIQLMQGVATGLPEYIIRADASNANFSSSMVSENPFVKAMESWQDFFGKYFELIYARVIQEGIDFGVVPGKSERTVTDPETGEATGKIKVVDTSLDSETNFPPLVHRDILDETKAIQLHIADRLVSRQTASEKLGYDYDVEQQRIELEDEAELERMKKMGMEIGPQVEPDDNGDVNNG